MDIKQSFGTALRNLFANKGRFAHVMLGMVIGAAGFILALSCGNLSLEYVSMQNDEYDPAVLKTWTFVSVDLPTQVMPWDMEKVAVEIELKRNSELYIPYTNALKMVGESMTDYGNYQYTYFVCANGRENMYETQVLIKEILQERTGREEKKGWILQAISMGETAEKIKGYVIGQTVQLTFLAAIVLLVGGVGIMNVMLASVQARTKEIGIRKAYGATNRDIQRQFALEAVVTSLFGGGFGMALGLAGMFIMCRIADVSLSFLRVSILPILAAFWVSTLIGIIFGTYPAKQAAKMEPLAAINSD